MSLLNLFVETSREMGKTDAEIAKELRVMANRLARTVRKEAAAAAPAPETKTGRSNAADRRASRTGLAFITAMGTKKAKEKANKPRRPMA